MLDLTVSSGLFILSLVCGPLILGWESKYRKWLFLFVNITLYALTIGNFYSLISIIIFTSVPYLAICLMKRRSLPAWPFIIVQVALFVVINNYLIFISDIGSGLSRLITVFGISYIFFRQLDVMLQVRADLVDRVPVIDYLNYLFSFYTIIAGPIQRYRQFIDTFYQEKSEMPRKESLKCFHRATTGLIKVLFIGTFLNYCSEAAYTGILENGMSVKYFVAIFYCFPLYIYFNFSGYCDVVIAMGKWAGLDIPENFNKPYLSRDLIEFWNRWHITLSTWLRDYVYQPFYKYLLSDVLKKQLLISQYISIFVTFFIVGVWHGAYPSMVIYGLLLGFGMAVSMIYRDLAKKLLGKTRYKNYYNNKLVANIERFICLNYMCFSILYIEYDGYAIVKDFFVYLTGVI